jgi:multiple sugar transport system substrate-binding protein
MKSALESVKYLVDNKIANLEECDKINNNYNDVIMRFFEGDVPMMICNADTASGTKKREKKSEAFTQKPFKYSFAPIPMADGGYFIDSPSVEFSVNKNCDNLEMTNEFMRFLISNKELNMISSTKGLVTPTKKISFDSLYVPFSKIPAKRIILPEVLGIKDPLAGQIKNASFRVGRAELTIEEAIAKYGSIA